MVIDGTDPFTATKPNARLVKLLLRARRFNAALTQGEGIAFAALAQREGVSRSYFTRLVRLGYLAPDIIQAILDGRQPRDLTPEKLLEHSRLPLAQSADRAGLWLSPVRAPRSTARQPRRNAPTFWDADRDSFNECCG
jgi:hypothetical protein